jgi:hypothetical protein
MSLCLLEKQFVPKAKRHEGCGWHIQKLSILSTSTLWRITKKWLDSLDKSRFDGNIRKSPDRNCWRSWDSDLTQYQTVCNNRSRYTRSLFDCSDFRQDSHGQKLVSNGVVSDDPIYICSDIAGPSRCKYSLVFPCPTYTNPALTQVSFAKQYSNVSFGVLCFIVSIISLGYNLAHLASLLPGQALNPALGTSIIHSIYNAQVKSAGTPQCRHTDGLAPNGQLPLIFCSAGLATAVTTGLMLSRCASQSEGEFWRRAPMFVGPVVFAAWSMVISMPRRGVESGWKESICLNSCLMCAPEDRRREGGHNENQKCSQR